MVYACRVLNGGNSLKWHHEIFKWLDEWVGAGPKKQSEGGEEEEPALRVQQ